MKEIHLLNLAFMTLWSGVAFIVALGVFPMFIRFIQTLSLTKKIREESLSGGVAAFFKKLHGHKSGTPTMGGVVIILAILVTVLVSVGLDHLGFRGIPLLDRGQTYLPLFTLAAVGVLGVVDDYLNIREKNKTKGLSAKVKLWTLLGFALIGAWWFVFKLEWSILFVPGIGNFDIGWWYAPLFIFILVATANAVNLTDGLDGLAGGLLAMAYLVMGVLAYFYDLSSLSGLCLVVVSALVAFLWFNVPPAKIYMGDVGSLALGAMLGVIAMLTNLISVLIIISALFIVETVSVILQLFWKKYFGRKLFLIAPLHHHFEAKGWSETQIVMRFLDYGNAVWDFGLVGGSVYCALRRFSRNLF